ncbi:MAG: hypothetical protein ACOYN0_00330 [Phycisphaerales bacterium]
MNRSRLIAVLFAATGAASMAISGASLTDRVSRFNEQADRKLYAFAPFDSASFTFREKPVKITDVEQDGIRRLIVDYNGDKVSLVATLANPVKLPDLKAHTDWLRIFRMADATGMDFDELTRKLERGEMKPRLILVARCPRPGTEAGWAVTLRKDWVFDFYEFKEEGGFAHERWNYPSNRVGALPAADELQPGTWQYEAALRLMPRSAPTLNFRKNALSNPGWELRVFALGGVAFAFGIAFAIAPKKRVAGEGSWN